LFFFRLMRHFAHSISTRERDVLTVAASSVAAVTGYNVYANIIDLLLEVRMKSSPKKQKTNSFFF
jgi:hypothetical protein